MSFKVGERDTFFAPHRSFSKAENVCLSVCVCGEGWYWRSHKEMPCHITWTNMLWSTRFWPNWPIHQQQAARWRRDWEGGGRGRIRERVKWRQKKKKTRDRDGLRKCISSKLNMKKTNRMQTFNTVSICALHSVTLTSKALQISYFSPFTLRNTAVNQI